MESVDIRSVGSCACGAFRAVAARSELYSEDPWSDVGSAVAEQPAQQPGWQRARHRCPQALSHGFGRPGCRAVRRYGRDPADRLIRPLRELRAASP